MSDILERLATMDPEEGCKLLNQLFNPLRGKHVGFREDDRSEVRSVVKTEQNKMASKGTGRVTGQVDYAAEWVSVYRGAEEANRRIKPAPNNRNHRAEETVL